MAKYAVIDLGTNTFNLLIAEQNGTKNSILHLSRISARLGKDGIGSSRITDEAFQRGIDAMVEHKKTIDAFECDTVFAFATSMVRDADNGVDFAGEVRKRTGIVVEIISGDKEAELICAGVRQAVDMNEKMLIMDIGGGSTEFIIADHKNIYWKKSYRLGVTRLYENFQSKDPISDDEIRNTEAHLENILCDLFSAVKKEKVGTLIGSAGSFESYAEIIARRTQATGIDLSIPSHPVDTQQLKLLIEELIRSSHAERVAMEGLHEIRRDLIVMASVLLRFVLNKNNFNRVVFSVYALKEGAMAEYAWR